MWHVPRPKESEFLKDFLKSETLHFNTEKHRHTLAWQNLREKGSQGPNPTSFVLDFFLGMNPAPGVPGKNKRVLGI